LNAELNITAVYTDFLHPPY